MTDDPDMFGDDPPRLGAPLFRERWSNRKAFWIGVYAGQGMSAPAICQRLDDGITPNTMSSMLAEWGYRLPPAPKRTYGPVKVMLSAKDRTRIGLECGARGVDMSELCRQVLVNVARDRLWLAVLDQ